MADFLCLKKDIFKLKNKNSEFFQARVEIHGTPSIFALYSLHAVETVAAAAFIYCFLHLYNGMAALFWGLVGGEQEVDGGSGCCEVFNVYSHYIQSLVFYTIPPSFCVQLYDYLLLQASRFTCTHTCVSVTGTANTQ